MIRSCFSPLSLNERGEKQQGSDPIFPSDISYMRHSRSWSKPSLILDDDSFIRLALLQPVAVEVGRL